MSTWLYVYFAIGLVTGLLSFHNALTQKDLRLRLEKVCAEYDVGDKFLVACAVFSVFTWPSIYVLWAYTTFAVKREARVGEFWSTTVVNLVVLIMWIIG